MVVGIQTEKENFRAGICRVVCCLSTFLFFLDSIKMVGFRVSWRYLSCSLLLDQV